MREASQESAYIRLFACEQVSFTAHSLYKRLIVPRSTMAWGLEARVPFLDKQFLEVAMNIDPREKTFSKGAETRLDEDGKPRMEKVCV